MSLRPCSEPGCPRLVQAAGHRLGNLCPEHRQEKERRLDAQRGSRQERGYGAEHEAERKRWGPRVRTGKVRCWRCGEPINPALPWDLGHAPGQKTWIGPECWKCNRGEPRRRGRGV